MRRAFVALLLLGGCTPEAGTCSVLLGEWVRQVGGGDEYKAACVPVSEQCRCAVRLATGQGQIIPVICHPSFRGCWLDYSP